MMKRFILILLVSIPLWSSAQKWEAPENAKSMTASFIFTDENKKAGEVVYQKNCQSCHGPVGKNMPAPIKPVPIDPALGEFQAQTDGEMFWKITNGKTPMPTFGAILSEDDRWNVIAYIRSFNSSYIQPAVSGPSAFSGVRLKVELEFDSVTKRLVITANEIGKYNKLTRFKGARVQLAVKRLFGRMNIGEPLVTDASGKAYIIFPSDVPGDKDGYLELHATVSQEGVQANPIVAKLKAGKPIQVTSLYAKHQMWSMKGDGPVWLSLLYGSIVITVWLFIGYVILQTFKMAKLGQKNKI